MGARRCVCTDALRVLSLCLHVTWLGMVGCGSLSLHLGQHLFGDAGRRRLPSHRAIISGVSISNLLLFEESLFVGKEKFFY